MTTTRSQVVDYDRFLNASRLKGPGQGWWPNSGIPQATLTRNIVSFAGGRLEKLATPTPEQRRVFELLGKLIPLSLGGT